MAKKSKATRNGTGAPIVVRVQPMLLDLIDRWRKRQADLPTRPEAIRRIVAQALERRASR